MNLWQTLDKHHEYQELTRPVYEAAHKVGGTLADYAKGKLGPQTRCWTGEYLWYLWEYEKFTLWVSKRGFSVECLETLTPQEAWDCELLAFKLLSTTPEDKS